tara:strand:+ start:6399 stop:7898 length:1500 start_codon:yes stop_codon:yes gene_type:complete
MGLFKRVRNKALDITLGTYLGIAATLGVLAAPFISPSQASAEEARNRVVRMHDVKEWNDKPKKEIHAMVVPYLRDAIPKHINSSRIQFIKPGEQSAVIDGDLHLRYQIGYGNAGKNAEGKDNLIIYFLLESNYVGPNAGSPSIRQRASALLTQANPLKTVLANAINNTVINIRDQIPRAVHATSSEVRGRENGDTLEFLVADKKVFSDIKGKDPRENSMKYSLGFTTVIGSGKNNGGFIYGFNTTNDIDRMGRLKWIFQTMQGFSELSYHCNEAYGELVDMKIIQRKGKDPLVMYLARAENFPSEIGVLDFHTGKKIVAYQNIGQYQSADVVSIKGKDYILAIKLFQGLGIKYKALKKDGTFEDKLTIGTMGIELYKLDVDDDGRVYITPHRVGFDKKTAKPLEADQKGTCVASLIPNPPSNHDFMPDLDIDGKRIHLRYLDPDENLPMNERERKYELHLGRILEFGLGGGFDIFEKDNRPPEGEEKKGMTPLPNGIGN